MSDSSGADTGHSAFGPNGTRRYSYSRFVRWMTIALPLAALALFALVLFYTGLFERRQEIAITFAQVETLDDDLRMISPRLAGLDSQGRPYVLTADTATQSPGDPNRIALENIEADLTVDAGDDTVTLTAVSGLLETVAEKLELYEQIDVRSTSGYEFHGTNAKIDFGEGTMVTNEPVDGQGPAGTLEANAMSAFEGGDVIHFTGGVRVVIQPGAGKTE